MTEFPIPKRTDAETALPNRDSRWRWIAPIFFAVLATIPFADVLFARVDRIAASSQTDISSQFIAWRTFGFTALRHGEFPLWNPHVFGGAPYFAGFQSALLYPPNWLHLMLPLAAAINWITVLHIFLAGYFTYLWCRQRKTSPIAGIIAGVMFMFSGPFFPHVYAGHLPHIAVITWLPLIFMALDGLCDDGRARWLLVGAGAIAAQILAGHPQYVYYTGIVVALYVVVRLFSAINRVKLIGGFFAIYLIAVAVAAIQLLPGYALTSETVRSAGLSKEMASTFSFPPEDLLTMVGPRVFGGTFDESRTPTFSESFFGRTYAWESSLFVTITGLTLALIALFAAPASSRHGARIMVLICMVLALGRHTPVYSVLFDYLPQYKSFRGTAKFTVFVALFLSVMAAVGFDRLFEHRTRRSYWLGSFVAAAGFLVIAMIVRQSGIDGVGSWWASAMAAIADNGLVGGKAAELFIFRAEAYRNPEFIAATASRFATALGIGAATFAVIGAVLFAAVRERRALFALVVVAIAEAIFFSSLWHATTASTLELPPAWANAVAELPRDQRVFISDIARLNSGLALGYDNIWGYDPGVLKRYAELLYASQNRYPDSATQYPPFDNSINVAVFPLVRCGLALLNNSLAPAQRIPGAFPVALLVHDCVTLSSRDDVLRTVLNSQTNLRNRVVLDRQPAFKPELATTIGEVRIVRTGNDELEIVAETDSPAMLLITNSFADGWRARSIGNAPQDSYEIQPADWAMQGIALKAGRHHLMVEYFPLSFRIGRIISVISLILLVVTTVFVHRWRTHHLSIASPAN